MQGAVEDMRRSLADPAVTSVGTIRGSFIGQPPSSLHPNGPVLSPPPRPGSRSECRAMSSSAEFTSVSIQNLRGASTRQGIGGVEVNPVIPTDADALTAMASPTIPDPTQRVRGVVLEGQVDGFERTKQSGGAAIRSSTRCAFGSAHSR